MLNALFFYQNHDIYEIMLKNIGDSYRPWMT